MRIFFSFLSGFIFCACLSAQNKKVDNLIVKANALPNDSSKVGIFLEIATIYWYSNPDSTILFANKSLALSEKLNFKKGMGRSYKNLGTAHFIKGNLTQALNANFSSLKIGKELKDDDLIWYAYNNIGNIYFKTEDFTQALTFYNKSLIIAKENKKINDVATSFINIANILKCQKKYSDALNYQNQALPLLIKGNDRIGLAILLHNIGDVYLKQSKYEDALAYIQKSLKISNEIDDREGIIYCYLTSAEIYLGKNDLSASLKYATEGLKLSKKFGSYNTIKDFYTALSSIAEKKKDFKTSLIFYKLSASAKDSVISLEKQKSINNLKNDYEINEKQQEIDHLYLDNKSQNEELSKQTLQRKGFILVFIVLIVLVIILIKNILIKKKINNLLELQNAEILDQKEEITAQSEEIYTQKELLLDLNISKDKLFSIISHDLRAPINSLQGALEILQEGLLSDDEIKDVAKTLLKKVQNTGIFLNNLLYWAKSQMGGIIVHPEKINIKILAENSIQLLDTLSDEKNIIIKNNIQKDIFALIDENMIELVVRNLLENAIKFTPENGKILIDAIEQGNDILMSVTDSGSGVKEEDLPKLFDSQTHFTTYGTANEKGTGLGLTLCKDFIEKNGGTIWVESKVGIGSKFCFTLKKINRDTIKNIDKDKLLCII